MQGTHQFKTELYTFSLLDLQMYLSVNKAEKNLPVGGYKTWKIYGS